MGLPERCGVIHSQHHKYHGNLEFTMTMKWAKFQADGTCGVPKVLQEQLNLRSRMSNTMSLWKDERSTYTQIRWEVMGASQL